MLSTKDIAKVFFSALEYPDFMRTNFYIRMQKKSGWAKGVYLTALSEVYHACVTVIQIHQGAPKSRSLHLTREQVEIPIKDITKGDETGTFNLKLIEELFIAIRRGWYFERRKQKYSAIEILTFAEGGLLFIRNEFRREAKKQISQGNAEGASYVVYLIAQEAPFIDFPKFKNAFRYILLNSLNIDRLKRMLKPCHSASVEIVNLYNKKIFQLENKVNTGINKTESEQARIEFDSTTLQHSRWDDTEHFNILSPSWYLNQDLAGHAAKIANLLSGELLGGNNNVSIRSGSYDFTKDFADGIHSLQKNDTNGNLIKNLKEGIGKKLEAPFRNYFNSWFEARRYQVAMESIKGPGHIDLKVSHEEIGDKIVEFKGWWNTKKIKIIQQLYSYLTQFEGDGYILMINSNKSSITGKYKDMITTRSAGYIKGSWELVKHQNTSFLYFISKHKLGTHIKEVHHFILDIY